MKGRFYWVLFYFQRNKNELLHITFFKGEGYFYGDIENEKLTWPSF